ncbi:MAG: hypothetical protein IKU30_02915 [Clostridia bacterium]|nr:hypothetical protein [Clostridia bacterium]
MDVTKIKNIAMKVVPVAVLVFFMTLPLYELIGFLTELEFSLYSEKAISILQALLAIGAVVSVFIFKPRFVLYEKLCLLFAFPLSIINVFSFIDGEWGGAVILAIISCGCIFAIYLRFLPDSVAKAISAIVAVLLAIVVCIVFIWNLVSGVISDRKLDDKYESLNKTFVAEVFIEESLISTKTVVTVRPSEAEFGAIIGCFSAPEMIVFEGEAHAAETIMINWLDDETVIINGDAYKINIE